MSDYFGSLLRASGLGASSTMPAPTPATNMAGSATSLAVPSASDSLEVESTTDRSLAPTPLSTPQTERTVSESLRAQSPAIHQDTTASLVQRDAEPHTAQYAKTMAAEPPPALDRHAAPSSRSLLQSTLQWIAADPEAPHAQAGSISTELSESHEPAQPIQTVTRPSLAIEAVASTQKEQAHRTDATTPTLDHAQLTVRPDHASPTRAARLRDADDSGAFDVSIGSIHVRVDAPAPQTVARAMPAASHSRAAPPPSRQRSSLARRALRRL